MNADTIFIFGVYVIILDDIVNGCGIKRSQYVYCYIL